MLAWDSLFLDGVLKVLSLLSLLAWPLAGLANTPASVGLPPTIPLSPAPANTGSTGTGALAIQFTSAGLTSLKWNSTEMLATGAPTIGWVGLVQPDGSWTTGDMNPVSTADVANRILTQTFAWGTIKYAYTTTATQMFADVTVTNNSSTPIGMFIIQLAEIKFPKTPTEYDGSDPLLMWNMGDPTVIHTTFGTSSMALTNEDVVNPLMVGYPWPTDSTKTTFPLRVLTGQDSMYPSSFPFINRQVAANGGTLEFKLGFRFGPASATNLDLAGDIYQKFAATYPQTLNWPDRRPIAELFLTNYNGTYAKNPRRWFGDPNVDITTPAGLAAFQQRVLAYADNAVAICKAMNAQAAVTWDIEGEQFVQPTSYIGDPRLAPTLAPDIDPVLDAYFKKIHRCRDQDRDDHPPAAAHPQQQQHPGRAAGGRRPRRADDREDRLRLSTLGRPRFLCRLRRLGRLPHGREFLPGRGQRLPRHPAHAGALEHALLLHHGALRARWTSAIPVCPRMSIGCTPPPSAPSPSSAATWRTICPPWSTP